MKNKVSLISQYPPPMHGLSKAVDTLYSSRLNEKYGFEKIDISNNKHILKTIFKILFSKCELFYLTIAQTKGGNFRDLFLLKLVRWKKKKYLIHLHGGYYRTLIDTHCSKWQQKRNYKMINKSEGCIVLSNSLKYIFEGLVANEKIIVLPNCIDDKFLIKEKNLNEKYESLREKPIIDILYLSNFIATKGYREVLELAKMAKEKQSNLRFHFAGKFFDNIEENYFSLFVEEHQLHDYITYYGVVDGNEKVQLLNKCHLFILLTTYPNEGQPISILEAMGNGMCIVTTNHAGIPDIVENNKNGLVIDKNNLDVALIYDKIMNTNIETIEQIGKYNYQTTIDNYTEKQHINKFDNTLQQILQ